MTATSPMTGLLPETIGPYRILWELGRGGMGVVYRGERSGGGPPVAIKMPSEEMSDLFGSVRREIHALSRLRHPGVVRIIEEGMANGVPWYAMQLIDGRPLDELLGLDVDWISHQTAVVSPLEARNAPADAQPLKIEPPPVRADLKRALTIMHRLARVLAYVHAHGIVHRDLKPQNVLVRPGDRPVLVDFGLMGQFRVQSGREMLEVGGLMMGTAIYAAPEQAAGELVDARADLYAFGTMLYEIVTGVPPFQARNVRDLLMMHLQAAPPRPSDLVRGVPPVLEKLILNLLEKRRGNRLGYADDVAEALVEAGAEADDDFKVQTAAYLYRPEIVGRKDTIETLRKRLISMGEPHGEFVALGGVSGIGKTSVAAAFGREAAIRRCLVVTAECDPVGGQPLHPLRPLLREIADYCRGRSDAMMRILGSRVAVLREYEPAIAALADDNGLRIPPEVASRRLFTDLAETLAAFARERPLVLILDDLQWADEVTLRFLSSLGREFFEALPLVILGTYRADEAGPDLNALLTREHISKLLLNRLNDTNVGDIVRSMLAAPDAPANFLEFLAAQTEGNPFFVAEYLRNAVAEQWLIRDQGRWRVAARDTYINLALPSSVRELVGKRLERLSPLAQRMVETAAVLGREIAEAELMATCGETESDALEGITELIEKHIFEPLEHTVRFAHDKLREGAYARLSEERRTQLHARAGEVIEVSCANDDELRRHAAELARHFDLGGFAAKATGYYAQAAETAVGSGACREAVDLMNRALQLDDANANGDPEQRGYLRTRAHRVLTFAHFGLGDLAKSADEARRSLDEAGVSLPRTSRGWRIRLASEAIKQAAHFVLPRRSSGAEQPLLREITMASQKFSEGRYYTAEQTVMLASGLIAVNAAERLNNPAARIHAYANFGAVTSGVGLFRLSRHYYDAARRLAIETNDLNGLGHIGYTSAALYITVCDWKSCALYLADAVAAAKKVGDDQVIEMNETATGLYQFYTGALEEAAKTFASVRDRAHKRFNHQHEAWGHSFRAGALILLGRVDEALASADAALALLAGFPESVRLGPQVQRCHALLESGNLDAALAEADVVADMVSRIPTIIWERYRALSVPSDVYLAKWTRDGDEDQRLRRAIRPLLRRLQGVSRRMPLALPVTLRLSGVLECLEGNARRGEKLLRKSIAAATRLQLPIEEVIGRSELARRAKLNDEGA